MKVFQAITICVLIVITSSFATARDLSTIMMEATCKISMKGKPLGTGFIIGKPDEKNPPEAFYTLVTADHVFRASKEDTVILSFRQKQGDNTWKRLDIPLQIRKKKEELWQKHPDVDVLPSL